ncbi:hypothetical protein ABIB82_004760 [Bradyrhizobium sp. i1.8.4]|uniref:hypothetical protein n=1 Tax=unclassified Bradyrhizobium TaxID=2631580 RepID=UPI003D19BEE8
MARETFDVVILGGGNAEIGVTGPVRRDGLSVAMIGGARPRRHLPESRLHGEERRSTSNPQVHVCGGADFTPTVADGDL